MAGTDAGSIAKMEVMHNNGLHTEPFLGRVSMLCFLYGPGEPGRYPDMLLLYGNGLKCNSDLSFQ